MSDFEWQVHIDKPVDYMAIRVYIFRDVIMPDGARCREFITNLSDGTSKRFVTKVGTLLKKDVTPAILLDFRTAEMILEPLVRALVKDGIVSVKDKKETTNDELKATQYHLEDMRELIAHVTAMKKELVFKRHEVVDPGF